MAASDTDVARYSNQDVRTFIWAAFILGVAVGGAGGAVYGFGRAAERAKVDQYLRDQGAVPVPSEDGVERYRIVRFPKP